MGTCNATITVLVDADEQVCKTLECSYEAGHDRLTKHNNTSACVLWEDGAPGSTPHTNRRVADLVAERDRYRAALRKIARPADYDLMVADSVLTARDALWGEMGCGHSGANLSVLGHCRACDFDA